MTDALAVPKPVAPLGGFMQWGLGLEVALHGLDEHTELENVFIAVARDTHA